MANFMVFDEGADILNNGLPATCYFLLSTRRVSSGTGTLHAVANTLAGGVGEMTGTGYGRKNQAEPTMATRRVTFLQMTWTVPAATTDWQSPRSIVLVTTSDNTGKAICAWDLDQGNALDLSAPDSTLSYTPTLGPLNNPA